MSKLKEIHDYLISLGKKEKELNELDKSSIYLSMEIMEFAHRNQKRENGEDYANHPSRCLQNYQNLVGIASHNHFCVDKDLMFKNGVPYDGVQEVCLLHDVIEDGGLTLDEIEEIFVECELGDYFRIYIKSALNNITHDKNIDYSSYIDICMENPISALCKMMDLQDNIYVLSLIKFDKKNYIRAENYLRYLFLINQKYQFIENSQKNREKFKKEE